MDTTMEQLNWQRAVIKVGSALISPQGSAPDTPYLPAIARFISDSREQGKEIILVSSGSVAAGRDYVPVRHQPTIAEKQAMAAIGQTQMMTNWSRFFDFPCAQLLLSYDDLHHRTRYVNIHNTLRELLKNNALPIINENDTVAVNELKVGDNDNLAAYTALVAQADVLIICSDVDGLFDANPGIYADAQLIPSVEQVTDEIYTLAGGPGSALGTGGMLTKLQAAQTCTQSGISTLIINGQKSEVFAHLLNGKVQGTHFKAQYSKERARRKWLEFTLKSRGTICIDEGACLALQSFGASLLACGILTVSGDFKAGEAVDIECKKQRIGKGLVVYNAHELKQIKGQQSQHFCTILGYTYGEEAIHRDDLIIFK